MQQLKHHLFSLGLCVGIVGLIGPLFSACGDDIETDPDPLDSLCPGDQGVACVDDLILELNLQDDVAPGLITNTAESNGWLSEVDATAGGAFATDPDSFVYARFDEAGLEKVPLSDEDAVDSVLWDIAFRRYVIRINSGDSGPACVVAARLPDNTDFASLTSLPESAAFRQDDFFTDSCDFVNDGSGLNGSPATALSSYWSYPGCVQMTFLVYGLQLTDGRRVKLMVTQYYSDAAHDTCQNDPTHFSPMGADAAHVELRWAFLDS